MEWHEIPNYSVVSSTHWTYSPADLSGFARRLTSTP